MNYLSLFSGVGGFELGIQRAFNTKHAHVGEESESEERPQGRKRTTDKRCVLVRTRDGAAPLCIGYSEIDKYAIQTYEKNWKGHTNYGNATTINPAGLPNFDLLVGGFPCQAFSVAGKRKGFDDTRGTLFFDIARILSVKRPRHIFLENVKGLLTHDSGKTFQTILGVLADLGYRVEWQVLNGKRWVPQNRERVVIIGHLREKCERTILPISGQAGEVAQESISTAIDANYFKGIDNHGQRTALAIGTLRTHNDGKGFRKIKGDISPTIPARARNDGSGQPVIAQAVLTPDRLEKRQNGRRVKDNNEPSFTLNTQDKHGIFNGIRIRRLTPLECERLMGWPDNWTEGVSDTQRYKQCGNGIIAPMVTEVIIRMQECLQVDN